LVKLDVIGKLVTLSEREAEELRAAAAAETGRSSARRDLSLLLDRGLRTRTTVALSRAEARELAELLRERRFPDRPGALAGGVPRSPGGCSAIARTVDSERRAPQAR
jgi:hypothetical protein